MIYYEVVETEKDGNPRVRRFYTLDQARHFVDTSPLYLYYSDISLVNTERDFFYEAEKTEKDQDLVCILDE